MRLAVTTNPLGVDLTQRRQRRADIDGFLVIAGKRCLGVIMDRQIAGHLIQVRAVVQQPLILHDRQVVQPRRLIGDTDRQFLTDHLAQRNSGRRRRTTLLKAGDVGQRGQARGKMLADRVINRGNVEQHDADIDALGNEAVEIEHRIVVLGALIRSQDNDEINADGLGVFRQLDHFIRILMMTASDQRHAALGGLDVNLVAAHALFVRQRPELGNVARAVMAVNLQFGNRIVERMGDRLFVDLVVSGEMVGQRGPNAFQRVTCVFFGFIFTVFHWNPPGSVTGRPTRSCS